MQMTASKGYPLSMQQARLWALRGESQTYSVQCSVQLKGTLDMTALLDAFQHLVKRHDILRTGFSHLPGMEIPVQAVASYVKVHYPVIDLENLSASDQTALLDEYFTALKHKDVELEAHSPLFIELVRLSSKMHQLFLHLPALCADGETLTQMVAELGQTYTSLLRGTQQDDEPLQYADVAAWQQELVVSEEGEALREYWRKIDLSPLANIRLPFEQKEPVTSSQMDIGQKNVFAPRILELPLEESISAKISHLAHHSGISIEVWFLACWEAVLWHLNGKQDLVIGVAQNGRYYEELTNALGLYTRFVPIRTHLQEDQPFDQVVTSVNRTFLEATKRQIYFTWEEASTGNPTTSSFFPLCFEYECWPASFAVEQLTISLTQRSSCTEPFSLKLSVVQKETLLELALHYNSHRISMTQVQRLATVFWTLFEQVVAQPQVSVSRLSLLKPEEQASLLAMGCASTRQNPFQGIHHLFAEQARRQPSQLAVISAREHLTYQQLNEQANRLAQVLRQQGIGPNVLVGLLMGRQAQMLVGLLGILKAGGAYLPLDPLTPQERLSYLLQESGTEFLLVQHEVRPHLPTWRGKTLCLEDLELELSQASTEDLPGGSDDLEGEDLAYVIYTSGSTGVPKGVMVRQSSVVNYTLALCEQLGAEPGWQYATVSTLAADLGNTAIFCALASGGCVQVLNNETVTSAEAMARWVEQHPIDVLKIVPSHLSALLESEQAQTLLPRRVLICGGEVFPISLLERVQNLDGSCQVYNHYGPTEATIGVLVNPLSQAQVLEEESAKLIQVVALGRPIPNTEVYVLDSRMQLVPVGVTGELYIGGAGLALGYRHQPEQTAEWFVPHPWSPQGGARLYRTGDRARYDEEGRIEFVGRADKQIKLRGYRIELAEIETVLRRHPQIRDCAVLLQEDGPAGPRLIGYVVAHTASGLTSEALGKILRNTLPEYMIPSFFVMVDALPLTANGKVDRRQLPKLEQVQSSEPVTLAKPRSPMEEMLLSIWKELLVVPLLGINDNFFAVGGHSLLATRLIAQIRAMLQVELPVQAVFDAPTVAGLAQLVEQVLRKGKGTQIPPLMARARPEVLPLSFAQQRLWFLDQFEPESTAYLVPHALRMGGKIDVSALQRSMQELINRHESLRTTFEERNGQPVQVIHPSGPSTLPVIDLQGLREESREQQARWLASQESQRPCNLATGPLLRIALLRLAPHEHLLLLTLHHIITDGWSNGVLVRELTTLYQAFLSGQPSPLAPLPIQYADYALWQREWLQGEVLEASLSYWRSELTGVPPLELPIDYPRPPVQTYRGASQVFRLSPVLSEQLLALSRRQNVTLFMLLLAAFQVLLARYTGQREISVGTPIANRNHAEIEGVIGFFVNTLVLRTNLSGNPTFLDVLQRVREVCLGAYAHQDVPFEKVVEELEPERDLGRSPLFQVMLMLQNVPREQDALTGVRVSPLGVESTISKFDLTLSVTETEQGLHCALGYSRDLFEPETIRRLLSHWQTLLEGLIANPRARLSHLPLLTAAEQECLLVTWNATKTEFAQDGCVHELFEQQVQRTPEAIAVVFEDEQVTYQALNQRANQLAHYFQQLGVGPEVLVGICMDRSIEMVVAILGVLKAGGAYVPLDPGYPEQRLAFLLEDAEVFLLVVQQHHLKKVLEHHCLVICLETAWPILREQPRHNLPNSTLPDHLAYVMYTSGSTGTPKGVMISHRAISNRLLWGQRATHLTTSDRTLQVASLSFDISLWEIFGPLLAGACLVQAHPEGAQDSQSLLMLLQEQQITVAHFVPTLFDILLQAPELRRCRSLRCVLYGGEASSADLPGRFFAQSRGQLQQFYGPTEASINATSWVGDQERSAHLACIGRPIANMQVYVLDPDGQPVPIGSVGEISLGGAGLARGYFKRADLSAERFVPHPWSQEPGARLYRTGDLGRYRSDGNLEFVGRKDQQVKIRGYRIELGEIEAVLRAHPAVQEGVVLAREDVPGEKRLVAYVVGSQEFTAAGLRSFLQEKLPTSMIPSQFLPLDVIPLTPNGKLDRKSLPAPEEWHREGDEGQQRARTGIEEVLVELWSKVLGHPQVGIHDTFFELGGHSLLVTQLLARVRAVLGVELPVRAVFEAPTVAELAQRVEQVLRKGEGTPIPPLVARARPEVLPLSFAQQRLWFLDQFEPESPVYLMPSALHLNGTVDAHSLEYALEALIDRHESLRTTFEEQDGQPVQVIHPAGPYSLPVIDLQGLEEELRAQEARRLASQERQHPCDLATGPLLRTYLLRLGSQEHVLLLTQHHIISDGWSNEVLMRELTTLYQAFVSGEPSPLVPLSLQYADYALWQREWLQGEVLETQLAYWRTQLAGIAPLELPTDHPCPPVQTYRGASQVLQLSPVLSEQLVGLSRQQNVTLFMLLLAAFEVLLARYTGQRDIGVGIPIANRRHAEIEGIIGLFVNTLVLRTNLSGNPTFLEVLQRVRQVCLGAYAHQDLPFEKVVEELVPERDLSRSPLFQVMLVLQNTPRELGELAEVSVKPLSAESQISKFDLTLSVVQTEQGLRCWLEYNTDLFEASTIARMLSHWQTLLEGVVHNLQARISDVPLLAAAELEQLLVEWNATQADSPREVCVHQLFEQQVERTPDAVALVFEEQQLTYGELNRLADHLASDLQCLGVGPEVPVGLDVDRSLEVVIGLLGILKAGGVCVPFDPTAPKERLSFVLTETQMPVCLTQRQGAVHIPEDRVRLIRLGDISPCLNGRGFSHSRASFPVSQDAASSSFRPNGSDTSSAGLSFPEPRGTQEPLWAADKNILADMAEMGKSIGQRYPYAQASEKDSPFIPKALGQGSSGSGRDKHQSLFAQQCQVNPLKRGSGEHLAYIIYTSGSTGQPKGVAVTHNALATYCQTVLAAFDLQISDRVLQFHTLLFDVSLEEILPTLIAGAQLVLREREVWTPTELAEKALRFGLTVLDLPTAYWHQLAQDWLNRPPERLKEQLRLVIIGGERVVPKYLELWFQTSLCPVRLISAYGPTETTIAATMCNLSVPCEETEVPIGRPLAGGSVYVLDGYGNPVPIGVAGELFIGGDLLARGYLNRADMTAERFVPNPFGDEEGSRLYKTGDLVHYLPDGNLVFLGRMDQQVKIRGYRIELGEIETALQTHPAVQEAVVLAREDVPGEKRLVAYVVGPQEVTAAGLRSFLHEKLPAYMIPSQFLLVDAIPLTPSGKLDRKALPAPQVWCGQAEEGQQRARTGIEEVLVELWGKVLGHTQVGIHDTFFELGGHSLLATQLLARIRAVLGVELAVRVVFEAPTVAELAQRVEQALRKSEGTQIPALVARARPEVLPLSFAQQRLWFLDQFEPGSPKYLVSNAIRIGGKIDVPALQGSLQELISRHESLRTTFEERDGQPVQVIHPAGPYLLPVIDLQGLGEKEREQQARRLASQERQHPCNLATGPLLRTYLLRLEPQEDVLLLTLHHIITDGWSNEVLVRELTLLYQAFLSAQPSPLAPLPLQYVDYALWQRAWFQGEVLEAQLDYWTRRLGGAPPIKLPTDYPRPPVVNSRGASHPFALPADLSRALVALSRQEDVTLFMLLLAAFQVLFYRYTGQLDIVIGTDSANRHRIETEEIIGFFVNLLVLRTDLSGQPTFREVLKRVREVALGAYAHQDTPFDLLVEKLASDRYLDRMPIVQVLFVLQNISLEPVRGREIEHEAVSQPSPRSLMDEETTVKFDLALFMWERGGKLFGNLNYRLDLFKASTIATMVARFEVLLQSIVKEPDMPIDLLECVSDAECIQQEQEERALRSELLQRDDSWFDLSERFFTKNNF